MTAGGAVLNQLILIHEHIGSVGVLIHCHSQLIIVRRGRVEDHWWTSDGWGEDDWQLRWLSYYFGVVCMRVYTTLALKIFSPWWLLSDLQCTLVNDGTVSFLSYSMVKIGRKNFLGGSFTYRSSICLLTDCVIHTTHLSLINPCIPRVDALGMYLDFLGLLQLWRHILYKLLKFDLLCLRNIELLLWMVGVFSVIVMSHLFIKG